MGTGYIRLKIARNSDHATAGNCNRKSLIVVQSDNLLDTQTCRLSAVSTCSIWESRALDLLLKLIYVDIIFKTSPYGKLASCLRPLLTRRHWYQYSNCYGQQESDEGIKMKGKPKQDEGLVSGSGREKICKFSFFSSSHNKHLILSKLSNLKVPISKCLMTVTWNI